MGLLHPSGAFENVGVTCVITKNPDQHKRDRMGLLHPSGAFENVGNVG
jgi:hypothetical protein